MRKQRGQIGTFDASLKVGSSQVTSQITGDSVKIYAGEGTPFLIFTGVVRAAKISPCFNDPDYVMLSISGKDTLSILEGKKYTRRVRATKSSWCAITSVVRKGLKSGKFTYKTEPILYKDAGPSKDDDTRVTAIPQGPGDSVGKPAPSKKKKTIASLEAKEFTDNGVA